MSIFFKPYEGNRPFLFVSYAHRQSEAVINTIRILHDQGYRLWYDEGIPAGSDWPACIANHMRDCEKVLFFLSARAMESPNCYSEMCTAARLHKKILVIRLEKVPVEERWHPILDNAQDVPLLDSPEARANAILGTGFITKRYRTSIMEKIPWRVLGMITSLVFFLGAAGVLGALASGAWTPFAQEEPALEAAVTSEPTAEPTEAPTVSFVDGADSFFPVEFTYTLQERAVRRALGLSSSDTVLRSQLNDITELFFCGNMATTGMEAIRRDAEGNWLVNEAPVVKGQISDLSFFQSTVYLEKLALIDQPSLNLSGLNGLLMLKELSLAGSEVKTVYDLDNLPRLEILHLEYTKVQDLRVLSMLPSLKTVTVSRDMLPLTWKEDAKFEVILLQDE